MMMNIVQFAALAFGVVHELESNHATLSLIRGEIVEIFEHHLLLHRHAVLLLTRTAADLIVAFV